jgi:hypothetical protein
VIGAKSLAALAAAAAAAARTRLELGYLESLSVASCIAIGLVAALAAALVAVGWRPGEPSRAGLGLRGPRMRGPGDARVRELPASLQHALFLVAFSCAGLTVFSNEASARLTRVPAELVQPPLSGTCPEPKPAPIAAAPAPPPEVPGCALIKRAYQLGYATSLGSCAPGAPASQPVAAAPPAPCALRQRDEPILHFGWRRLVERTDSLGEAHPVDTVRRGLQSMRLKLDHIGALVAHQRHAVAATRHASHHIWLNLPAPAREPGLLARIAPPRCAERYERAASLWPAAKRASALVEEVIGQLLFAPGFAVAPAQCDDYVLHWGASAAACRDLIADPAGFLAAAGALDPIRDVLDRRRRQLELGELDRALARRPTVPAPPGVRALVSLQCFTVDPSAPGPAIRGREIALDGESISVRELRIPSVTVGGAGPIEVYDQVARLLAGSSLIGPEPGGPGEPSSDRLMPVDRAAPGRGGIAEPVVETRPGYLLTGLDPLRDADPFAGARWLLDRPDWIEIFPFHRHLHRFVDSFRQRYRAERGAR